MKLKNVQILVALIWFLKEQHYFYYLYILQICFKLSNKSQNKDRINFASSNRNYFSIQMF